MAHTISTSYPSPLAETGVRGQPPQLCRSWIPAFAEMTKKLASGTLIHATRYRLSYRTNQHCHCERSEASAVGGGRQSRLLRRYAPRNDTKRSSVITPLLRQSFIYRKGILRLSGPMVPIRISL
jgi:hypothetical protein